LFKVGELITSRHCRSSRGVVIEIKYRFGAQYCKVLWNGETQAQWVSSYQIAEHI